MLDLDKTRRYESWMRSHAGELYRVAWRLCRRADAAEDLVQETFCEAWRSLSRLKDSARARGWLFQILRYRHAHAVRDQSRRIQPTGSMEDMERQPQSNGDVLEKLAMRDALHMALDHLEEDLKVPFVMMFVEGLTCREVAEELKLPLGTVLSRIHRARQILRNELEPDREESSRCRVRKN